MSLIAFHHDGLIYHADMSHAIDLSIAVNFDAHSIQAFGAPPANASPLVVDDFIGDVNRGGSCNCDTYTLTPHCNGTHTECVGHITREVMTVNSVAPTSLLFASIISITPEITVTSFSSNDMVITRTLLRQKLASSQRYNAVVIRTLPNGNKMNTNYNAQPCAYFSEDALAWLANIGVDHLLVDLPSVDRIQDNGLLLAHRAFWGMPHRSTTLSEATRSHATITELIHVPDEVPDGEYLLNLQVAPLMADAAPSRPLLYPFVNVDKIS